MVLSEKKSKITKFLQDIAERVEHAIYEECLSENRISETIEFTSGWVEIEMRSDGAKEVAVCHSYNEHESPRLEVTIAGMLPDWYSVQIRAENEAREEEEYRDYLRRSSRYW